jgi:hypothetical protein
LDIRPAFLNINNHSISLISGKVAGMRAFRLDSYMVVQYSIGASTAPARTRSNVIILLFLHPYALGRAGPSAIYYTGKPHPCGPDEKPVSEIKERISY